MNLAREDKSEITEEKLLYPKNGEVVWSFNISNM